MARKRFTNENSARSFAKKVDGQLNDLREDSASKANFSVTYKTSDKTREHAWNKGSDDWCPEEGRDFGYPNDFWQD